jgi:DNA-binding FrmR family transcriptional regulator
MMNNTDNKILQKRLAIVEGHLKKIRKMVEEDAYCPDVIHQSQAVQAALKKIDEIVLHGHLHSCVLKDVHGTKPEREKIVEEIVEVFKKKN